MLSGEGAIRARLILGFGSFRVSCYVLSLLCPVGVLVLMSGLMIMILFSEIMACLYVSGVGEGEEIPFDKVPPVGIRLM
jgi:hypothetical protein